MQVSRTQPLTERQELILRFIRESIRARGYPPTLREIGSKMGISSTNGVSDHLRALERKGYLRREDMKSRALRPVDDDPDDTTSAERDNVLSVPLVGRVAAGPFSLAVEHSSERVVVDRALLNTRGEMFALRVRGDSMIDAGISEGDTIFVRRAQTAQRGDIVVARLGDETTVKRYFHERGFIRLQPENKQMEPIVVRRSEADARGFEILGTVVGLFRSI